MHDTLMSEKFLWVDSCGLLWSISRMFSRMLMSDTTSITECTQTLGRQPVSCIVWWTYENKPVDRILQSGVVFYRSMCIAITKPNMIYVSWYSAWENKRHCYDTSQLTVTVTAIEYEVTAWIRLAWFLTQGQTCARCGYFIMLNGYSTWDCKKMAFFSCHYLQHWCFCLDWHNLT